MLGFLAEMSPFAISFDGVQLYFDSSGHGQTALVFVHGWLGNHSWWEEQKKEFSKKYRVVCLDLAGHGRSSRDRKSGSMRAYAEDIRAVVEKLGLQQVVLIGHSMAGSAVIEAYRLLSRQVALLVLVDTLHDLDRFPTAEEVAPLFEGMKSNFKATVEETFRPLLFAPSSPVAVIHRVMTEFLEADPVIAEAALKPFYQTDIREAASQVRVPVRAIQSDLFPTQTAVCRKYFSDFHHQVIPGVGHYPMLEAPERFNEALMRVLAESQWSSKG